VKESIVSIMPPRVFKWAISPSKPPRPHDALTFRRAYCLTIPSSPSAWSRILPTVSMTLRTGQLPELGSHSVKTLSCWLIV